MNSDFCTVKKLNEMQKNIITLISIFMMLPVSGLAASEKAELRITYDCVAQHSKKVETNSWILDIGRTAAVFYNSKNRGFQEEMEDIRKITDVEAALMAIQNVSAKYVGRNSLEVLVNVPGNGEYTYSNKIGPDAFLYEEPLPEFGWTLSDSTKTVCGYLCRQAMAEVYGRTWTVWYAPEVTFPYGPYILGGLPGLILEAEDSEGIFHFTAVGIEEAPEDALVELSSTAKSMKCTRKKYLALRKDNDGKTYAESLNGLKGKDNSIKVYDPNGKEITNQKQAKKNYLDKQ